MKKILITAGPTNEYIDEVMKITNMSTGRLGIELTKNFLENENEVTLIGTRSVFRSGLFEKYGLANHPNLRSIPIETNQDMFAALEQESKNKDYNKYIDKNESDNSNSETKDNNTDKDTDNMISSNGNITNNEITAITIIQSIDLSADDTFNIPPNAMIGA